MSCRRIRRELIERFRFGELDARSAPHLAHLNGCVGCRDEVGIERSVVHHLQRALAERVVDRDPSPNAFEGIRRRALEPATPSWGDGLWRWARALPAGAAIALMGFAILSAAAPCRTRRSRGSPGPASRSARRSTPSTARACGSRATSSRHRRRAA